MLLDFLNNNWSNYSRSELDQEEGCQTSILDLSVREFLKEWLQTILEIIDELMDIGVRGHGQTRSDNQLPLILQQLKDIISQPSRRLIYLGITFIFLALLLFYFEITS